MIRGQVTSPPRKNEKKMTGKNLEEYPKPGATRFGAKRGNALINNKHFNAPRGGQYLKFKREIQVLNSWRAGGGKGWDTYVWRILILQRGLTFFRSRWSGLVDTRSARLSFITLGLPPLDQLTSSLDWFKLLSTLETIYQNPITFGTKDNFKFQFKI